MGRLNRPDRDVDPPAERPACPRPEKRVYLSKRAAKRALRDHEGYPLDELHAYRCDCGLFHIGHR